MTENEFLLEDRKAKIKSVIGQYGEEKFYVSFSGGKDSTVLSSLIDMALPGNQIPRVYADTGIELNMIRDFVLSMQKKDSRIVVIKPRTPIKQMLERDGYPFKSKKHAKKVGTYQRHGLTDTAIHYLEASDFACPKILRYQFTPECKLKIDYKCCINLKEKPLHEWGKVNNKPYSILGLRHEEQGSRSKAKCLAFQRKKLKNFHPLIPISSDWIDWFINAYHVEICPIYLPPYNFPRTGCKGCPFSCRLQQELDNLEKYFPNERKQCEDIWKPVYDEYRRIGYRLKPLKEAQIECLKCQYYDTDDDRCGAFECNGMDCPDLPCETKSDEKQA